MINHLRTIPSVVSMCFDPHFKMSIVDKSHCPGTSDYASFLFRCALPLKKLRFSIKS